MRGTGNKKPGPYSFFFVLFRLLPLLRVPAGLTKLRLSSDISDNCTATMKLTVPAGTMP